MEGNQQYASLIDMGCSAVLSEAAILSLKSQDLSALLDWISEHSEQEEKWAAWVQEQRKNPAPSAEKGGSGEETAVSIDSLINKEFCDELVKKGNSKVVAQKALLFTQSISVKLAENWIEDHKYDLDFEEEAVITQQAEAPKLTPEEAKQKLKELTEKARAIKKQREEEDAREREKNRLKSGKEAAATKQILEEQAKKRQAELDRIQKAKDDQYKKKLIEQMRRERNEKLGKSEDPAVKAETPLAAKKAEVKYTKVEQVQLQCEQVKVGMHAYPEKGKTFFETAQIYVNNIIKNNGEEKFRKINKENKAFQSRVVEVFGGVETLEVIGYQEEAGFLVLQHWDIKELQSISAILQRYAGYYN